MRLIRSIDSPALPRGGCALTIGNFDAVHIGHREILRELTAQAKKRRLPPAVMTFDPHPQEYFRADSPVARLSTTPTRFFALRECGVEVMLSLKFNRALARTDAEHFVREYLARRLRVRYLLIGDDFRFGARRAGDFDLLRRMAPQCNYEVELFDTVQHRDHRVSSTWIRELLRSGDLAQAARLLGRRYAHTGRVTRGDGRGRQWGLPTINLAIRHRPALAGVFAVTVDGVGDARLDGVASLGTRPSVQRAGAPEHVLEVHLFDYDGDAYGRRVCVEFVDKIRDEEKFDNYAALIARIHQDIRAAKVILAQTER
ncbi:MAG: bifunctional riboflavin kinase/FAD synthetase [bacterium]